MKKCLCLVTMSAVLTLTLFASELEVKPANSGKVSAVLKPDRLEDDRNRFLTNCKVSSRVLPPGGGLVVVAEGDYEARSLGSYSMRLYAAKSANADQHLFPVTIDNFKCGLIQPRENGFVEKVFTRDLLGDGREEIIVTIRSVGRYAMVSADAFRVDDDRLTCVASVTGFPANADVATLLSFKLKPAAAGTTRWFEAVEAVVRVKDAKSRGPDVGSVEWQRAVSDKVFANLDSPAPKPGSKVWFDAMNKHVLVGLPQVDGFSPKANQPK
jgi:hypothetical protein